VDKGGPNKSSAPTDRCACSQAPDAHPRRGPMGRAPIVFITPWFAGKQTLQAVPSVVRQRALRCNADCGVVAGLTARCRLPHNNTDRRYQGLHEISKMRFRIPARLDENQRDWRAENHCSAPLSCHTSDQDFNRSSHGGSWGRQVPRAGRVYAGGVM